MVTRRRRVPFADEAEVAVRVWDWPLRLFHWLLVIAVVVAVVCVKLGGEWMAWHVRAGYTVLALVLFRIGWGFAGSRWSRFSSFVKSPAKTVAYVRTLLTPSHEGSVGHNALGGWSVLAMLLVLGAQAGTGLFMSDDVLTEGPLYKHASTAIATAAAWIHNRNEWVIYALVALHICAIIAHRIRFGDDLVTPMFTGVKSLPGRYRGTGYQSTPVWRAVLLGAAALGVVWAISVAA